MSIIQKADKITMSHNLSEDQKIKAQIARLALFAGFMPIRKEGQSGLFIHFSNGVQNVFISRKAMPRDVVAMNLSNICRATGLSVQDNIFTLTMPTTDISSVCNKIQNQISRKYEASEIVHYDSLEQRLMDEQKYTTIPVANHKKMNAEEILAIVEKNLKEYPRLARSIAFDAVEVDLTEQQVNQDMEDVRKVREHNRIAEMIKE